MQVVYLGGEPRKQECGGRKSETGKAEATEGVFLGSLPPLPPWAPALNHTGPPKEPAGPCLITVLLKGQGLGHSSHLVPSPLREV